MVCQAVLASLLFAPLFPPAQAQECDTTPLSASMRLERGDDGSYCANFSVGTPAQWFRLVVDTSSGDLWVPEASALRPGWQVNHSFFRPNLSSTYVDLEVGRRGALRVSSASDHPTPPPSRILSQHAVQLPCQRWEDGVTAEASVDDVGVSASLNVSAPFGLATDEDDAFGSAPWDGVVGLALPATGRIAPSEGLLESLTTQAGFEPVFSLFLEREGSPPLQGRRRRQVRRRGILQSPSAFMKRIFSP